MSLEELDEHERSEHVREWVRKNIGSIVLGLVAGIGAIYGMEQWGHYRQRNAGLAGDDYRVYAEAVIKKDATAVATLGKSLRDKYPDSPYASMVALNDAATAVTDGKTDAALTSLEWAEAHATMPEVKSLSMLRRAGNQASLGDTGARRRPVLRGTDRLWLGKARVLPRCKRLAVLCRHLGAGRQRHSHDAA